MFFTRCFFILFLFFLLLSKQNANNHIKQNVNVHEQINLSLQRGEKDDFFNSNYSGEILQPGMVKFDCHSNINYRFPRSYSHWRSFSISRVIPEGNV